MSSAASPDGYQCDYAHDNSGNIIKKRFGNGAVAYYTYDKAERVSSIRHVKSDGTPIVYFDYARDAAGRITKIGREGNLAIYYNYDSVDRLTGEVWRRRSDSSQIYGFWYDYDLAGNRTRMRREFGTGVEWESAYYAYDKANALTKRQVMPGSVTTYYKYDQNGSQTKEYDGSEATYYDYGPHGLITQITPPPASGNPWRFYYDGKLNRYKMDKGGAIGYFLWDGMNLLEERDATGSKVAKYSHGETPIAGICSIIESQHITPTTTYYQYLHADHQGTVHAMTDSNNTLSSKYTQDFFGRQISPTTAFYPNLNNIFVYQANWHTHLLNNSNIIISPTRLYFALLGRFSSVDVLNTNDSQYPQNSQYNIVNYGGHFVDPDGLVSINTNMNRGTGASTISYIKNGKVYEIHMIGDLSVGTVRGHHTSALSTLNILPTYLGPNLACCCCLNSTFEFVINVEIYLPKAGDFWSRSGVLWNQDAVDDVFHHEVTHEEVTRRVAYKALTYIESKIRGNCYKKIITSYRECYNAWVNDISFAYQLFSLSEQPLQDMWDSMTHWGAMATTILRISPLHISNDLNASQRFADWYASKLSIIKPITWPEHKLCY